MSTPYHAKYYANELTRRSSEEGVEKLSRSLFDATVDLNPHQIEAALFAFRSPLSKGVILADEVGLGKTIEAGLVLCQYWAERKRKLLVICPASLRKQWSMELEEKFNLPSFILEAKSYRECKNQGKNPLLSSGIIITSYQFANRIKNEIRQVAWDLVVIDEAHKLRNVYRSNNKMGRGIKWAIEDRKKILLTATPLQNTLLELYGLSLLIDDHLFGDIASFRSQYMNNKGDLQALKERLKGFCHRTLRRQVLEYIKYTERRAITFPFHPTNEEQELYQAISDFLMREDTFAIPKRQRTLTTLILRKLLASSSQALAGTLTTMKERLEKLRDGLNQQVEDDDWIEELIEYEEMDTELIEEDIDEEEANAEIVATREQLDINLEKIESEITELERYILWAKSIKIDSKSRALLKALKLGFEQLAEMGANRKALIFTESRRTQAYLKDFLEANGYAGKIVLFNGSNSDEESKAIYERWLAKQGIKSVLGVKNSSRSTEMRQALVEYFRDEAEIMIATESAAEGVNLQFCSLVVNYDLPWNPQRIEQRIGRCHRYGQKHDVVVINFLNQRNEADQRVYQLLEQKFNLFSGVLGASDEVLGTIESGVDFEKRILAIYQQCRTPEEIQKAFDALQQELDEKIKSRIADTRQALLENFDEDVHARLKINLDDAQVQLDRFGKMFWRLTRFILDKKAMFDEQELSFWLIESPSDNIPTGEYQLISKRKIDKEPKNKILYRLSHPLGEYVVNIGKTISTPSAEVIFDISNHPAKISVVEQLKGKSGYLILNKLTIESYDTEEYLLFNAFTDDGISLDQEVCEKMFNCLGNVRSIIEIPEDIKKRLIIDSERHMAATISKSLENNNRYFQEERERLEKWADDMILAAEKALAETKAKIKELKRQERHATTLQEQHQIQLKIRELEKLQRRQRQQIFDVEDEIMEKRDQLIDELEKRMKQRTEQETLFMIRWKVV